MPGASVCSGEQVERPACNAQNLGRLWPDQTNWDREAVWRAGRCGELLICTRGILKHNWQALTVNVHQLGKGRKHEVPACGATNARPTSDSPADQVAPNP